MESVAAIDSSQVKIENKAPDPAPAPVPSSSSQSVGTGMSSLKKMVAILTSNANSRMSYKGFAIHQSKYILEHLAKVTAICDTCGDDEATEICKILTPLEAIIKPPSKLYMKNFIAHNCYYGTVDSCLGNLRHHLSSHGHSHELHLLPDYHDDIDEARRIVRFLEMFENDDDAVKVVDDARSVTDVDDDVPQSPNYVPSLKQNPKSPMPPRRTQHKRPYDRSEDGGASDLLFDEVCYSSRDGEDEGGQHNHHKQVYAEDFENDEDDQEDVDDDGDDDDDERKVHRNIANSGHGSRVNVSSLKHLDDEIRSIFERHFKTMTEVAVDAYCERIGFRYFRSAGQRRVPVSGPVVVNERGNRKREPELNWDDMCQTEIWCNHKLPERCRWGIRVREDKKSGFVRVSPITPKSVAGQPPILPCCHNHPLGNVSVSGSVSRSIKVAESSSHQPVAHGVRDGDGGDDVEDDGYGVKPAHVVHRYNKLDLPVIPDAAVQSAIQWRKQGVIWRIIAEKLHEIYPDIKMDTQQQLTKLKHTLYRHR